MPHGHTHDQATANLRAEIKDIQDTLAGYHSAKRYNLLVMELENLEGQLRAITAKRINNAPLADNPRLVAAVNKRPD